ncbi:MAG: chloride channel protein, partial [Bacteroidetes bacterium]|nr:chloride channel protein [Bacteroidota bacterium]
VFGTPLTGTIFAMEVLTIGKIQYDSLLPCLVASVIGDITCYAWGIHHTQYAILFTETKNPSWLHIDLLLLLKVITAGVCFGLCSFLFAEIAHGLKTQFKKFIKHPYLIPVVGGLLIIALTYISGTKDYLGLGVVTKEGSPVSIVSAFHVQGATTWSWLWKIIFTTVTLSSGFKGGEVTPLFFIGATLGNTLAILFNAPVDLFAGLGFIAVFAGATNTPLACTIMGIELFGGEHTLYFAIACFTAYFFSGHSGIYSSQKIAIPKIFDAHFSDETSLEESIKRRKRFAGKSLKKYQLKLNLRKDEKRN